MYDLADYSHKNIDSRLSKIHFYAFGGMKKTSDWLNNLENSNFIYNSSKQFETE